MSGDGEAKAGRGRQCECRCRGLRRIRRGDGEEHNRADGRRSGPPRPNGQGHRLGEGPDGAIRGPPRPEQRKDGPSEGLGAGTRERQIRMVQMVQGEVYPSVKDKGDDQERGQMVRDSNHQDQEEDQESQVMDQGVVDAEGEVAVYMEV